MKEYLLSVILASVAIQVSDPPPAFAELGFSGIFSDHMVLQRDKPVAVWGRAEKNQQVTITFAEQSVVAQSDEQGSWEITLDPLTSSKVGRELRLRSGDEVQTIQDVIVGDIWHASGQSNMAMTMSAVARGLAQAKHDLDVATQSSIRFRQIRESGSTKPLQDLPLGKGWAVCSPQTAPGFSAAAFYFARKLHDELGVPIGIIDSSRGGTPIEPFIPREAFQAHPTLRRELELGDNEDLKGIWMMPGGVRARDGNWLPGRLFHSRIAPIARFAVRGTIWYQGESNCGDGEDPRDYQHKMRALVNGWRKALGNDTMGFYFVQLPGSGAREGWPYLREQQRLSLDLPHTAMVVTIDLLHDNIHPVNKLDVGERLARVALHDQYGMNIPLSGPMFQRAERSGAKIRIHFTHSDSGLMVATKVGLAAPVEQPQAELAHFEVADDTGNWHDAEAVIDGATVIASCEKVRQPVAVRYAYAVNPQHANLYNRDGLPASPFCSDASRLHYAPTLPKD